jgi:PHD-finger
MSMLGGPSHVEHRQCGIPQLFYLQGHHPEGSPLVLCDGCPRAYHLACMRGVAWGDLPAGEWHCPRCTERRGAALRKLAEFEARKHEALEK